jgi:hypothetical protein
MKYLSLFILLFSISSCSEEEEKPNYSNGEFLKMARIGDPDLKLIIPSSISETLVQCSDYTPSCRYGLKVIVKKIQLKALFFDHQKDALEAALRIKGYVARNWVLDDVAGEPILERYVIKHLGAKKASEL